MSEHPKHKEPASHKESSPEQENDLIGLIKKMQLHLVFLEKKIDMILSQQSSGGQGGPRGFSRPPHRSGGGGFSRGGARPHGGGGFGKRTGGFEKRSGGGGFDKRGGGGGGERGFERQGGPGGFIRPGASQDRGFQRRGNEEGFFRKKKRFPGGGPKD